MLNISVIKPQLSTIFFSYLFFRVFKINLLKNDNIDYFYGIFKCISKLLKTEKI